MPRQKTTREEFKLRAPGFFAPGELGTWLRVSRNSVAEIAKRFGLRPIEGRYSEAEVYRKILGIELRDDQDRELLRRPLEGTGWLSRKTGVPASTVRAKVSKGTFAYPLGVQLSETSKGGAEPRSRRWIPCLIEPLVEGRVPPDFVQVACKSDERPVEMPGNSGGSRQTNNVFAQIARGNAQFAPQ